MGMNLYHFTSRHHIKPILTEGLTLGMIPLLIDPIKLIPGFQWLTKNKSFKQEWCDPKYSSLSYKRNDYRITIKIPKSHRKYLIHWMYYFNKKLKGTGAEALNTFGDPENWYVYKGVIKPTWFKKVIKNKNNYI